MGKLIQECVRRVVKPMRLVLAWILLTYCFHSFHRRNSLRRHCSSPSLNLKTHYYLHKKHPTAQEYQSSWSIYCMHSLLKWRCISIEVSRNRKPPRPKGVTHVIVDERINEAVWIQQIHDCYMDKHGHTVHNGDVCIVWKLGGMRARSCRIRFLLRVTIGQD